MANQDLLRYIREQLAAGVAPEMVRRALATQGWEEGDVNEGFTEAGETAPPPETSPAVPPIPPGQFTPRQDAMAGFTGGPVTFSPPGAEALQPIPASSPRRKRGLLMAVAAVCLLLALAGGGYAYLAKWGPFARPPYTANNLVSGLLDAASRIDSSSYRLSGTLAMSERDNDAVPFTPKMNDRELIKRYQHDLKRAQDVSGIMQNLLYARPYPPSLQALANSAPSPYRYQSGRISVMDPATNQPYGYARTEQGKNFSLTVTFETDSAISQLKRMYGFSATTTPIEGRRVTFTKDSSAYIYLPSELPQPLLARLGELVGSFPPGVSANLAASARTQFRKAYSDWKFNINAVGDFGDLSYKFDLDALKKDGTYYFRINNLPSLFLGSLAAVKGQWISVDANTASSSPSDYYNIFSSLASRLPEAEQSYQKHRKELVDVLTKAAAIADEEHLFIIADGPKSERVEGRILYRYDLKIRKEAIVSFYQRLLNETNAATVGGGAGFIADAGYIEYLQSSEFQEVFDYYDRNTALALWADPQGFPAVISYSLRVVPPDTATQLKNKQMEVVVKLELSDINTSVTIDAPKDAKPIQDLINQVNRGGPAMKSRDARRIADIKQLQLALELYYDAHAGYPTSLAVLADHTSCGGSACIPTIPTDPLSKAAYSYTYHSLNGKRHAYHLGASLEDPSGYGLASDSDCNSLTNQGCSLSGGAWNKPGAFDGGDDKGCGGEADRACYDVIP